MGAARQMTHQGVSDGWEFQPADCFIVPARCADRARCGLSQDGLGRDRVAGRYAEGIRAEDDSGHTCVGELEQRVLDLEEQHARETQSGLSMRQTV